MLHGLNSDPTQWFKQLSIVRKQNNIDVFVPVVPKRGNCSLNDATDPLLPTLLDYAKKNPTKPICLLGISNGGRLALNLETKLRETTLQTPVMVSSISGAHFGSSRMNLLEKFYLAKLFHSKIICEELRYGSDSARKLLGNARAILPENCAKRKYEFYASSDDQTIPDLDSTLPELNKGEKHYLLNGHSHDSIITAVATKQIASCVQWINDSK
jgi:hypothetical protein